MAKVFSDSTNINQDQAKILFDYYRQAAEKIVSEEVKLEQERETLVKDIGEMEKKMNGEKTMMIIYLVLAIASLLGMLVSLYVLVASIVLSIVAFVSYGKRKQLMQSIQNAQNEIVSLEQKYRNIRRDYAVEKLGVLYVPVATKVPFDNKSLLLDHTNTVDETTFQLNVMNQPEQFQQSVKALSESIQSIPVVETTKSPEEINTSDYSVSVQNLTLHDFMGKFDRQVRNIGELLEDSAEVSVDLPVIQPGSENAQEIEEYATDAPFDAPIIDIFQHGDQGKLSMLRKLNAYKTTISKAVDVGEFDDMKDLMVKLAENVQMMISIKSSGSSKLVNYASNILATVLKSGYKQYSPVLEAEEIERIRNADFDYKTSVNDYTPFNLKNSSLMRLDIVSGNWVANDGSRTKLPFSMHQVDEEVLIPVITALMQENRLERLKIYNEIDDQKREYLERWSSEVNSFYRDNRAAADDLITHMREAYSEYMGAYNMYQSLKATTESMTSSKKLEDTVVEETDNEAEMIAGFEQQTKDINARQEEFSDYMDRIQDDISSITNEFAHIEYFEASLRDGNAHDTAVAMDTITDLDPRRRRLVSISPYVAKYAKLPPLPKTSEELFEDLDIDLNQQVQESLYRLASDDAEASVEE